MAKSTLKPLAEGKTKIIWPTKNPKLVNVEFKDDITAGNGKRHEVIRGKGALAAQTSTAMFGLLGLSGIETAFMVVLGPNLIQMYKGDMIPLEVVIRFEGDGSWCKRNPSAERGKPFPDPVVEFYLKTTGPAFRGAPVPDDDPLITEWSWQGITVHHAGRPIREEAGVFIPATIAYPDGKPFAFERMKQIIQKAGGVIFSAARKNGCRLIDLKLEFDTQLRVSDEISPDSWRLLGPDGKHLDKQPFREGASVEETFATYQNAAMLASRMFLDSPLA